MDQEEGKLKAMQLRNHNIFQHEIVYSGLL